MMAARLGAQWVFTIEANSSLAEVAQKSIASNRLSGLDNGGDGEAGGLIGPRIWN